MYLFDGGYYSFDGDKKPECHYYIADYQGNNRMVVNAHTNEVEQTTHYYPYGGIIGNLSSNQEAQKYKFGGKELDRTYGLDLSNFEARMYDGLVPDFTSIDTLAEKYYSISPYAYCAGDPVNNIDQHGDSVCPLIYPDGAGGMGHAAILIQDDKGKWRLYSKNGSTGSLPSYGSSGKDDEGKDKSYNSPEEFINSTDNRTEGTDEIEYTEGVIIPCDKESDQKAAEAATKELNKNYNLLGSNCIVTVQKALEAAGLDNGSNPWRTFGIRVLSPVAGFAYSKIPNDVYRRIKKNKHGTEQSFMRFNSL